jgi:hypothetical protein
MTTTERTLAGLRGSLAQPQRRILDDLWEHLVQQGESMPERALLWKFGLGTIDAALHPLGGTVVSQAHTGLPFELTLLGAVLTSSGSKLCSLLETCLTFVRNVYRAGSMPRLLPSADVQRGCKFATFELETLRILLSRPETRNDFVVRAPLGGKKSTSGWDLFVLDNVWQLRDVDDIRKYADAWLVAGFDPTCPVRKTEAATAITEPPTEPPAASSPLRQPEARYHEYATERLHLLQGRCRITTLDLQILVESRFKGGTRTVTHRTFEEYLRKWRSHEATQQLLALVMHDVGSWRETDEQRLQECLDEKDRRALAAGRRKHQKYRKY